MKSNFLSIVFVLFFGTMVQAQGIVPRVEPLLGFAATGKGIQLQVASGGCTEAESFEVNKYTYRKIIRIVFIRVVPDSCLALLREGKSVSYSFEDLGLKNGESFQIMNPIQVHEDFE